MRESEPHIGRSLGPDILILSGFPFASSGFNALEGLPLIRIRDLAGPNTEVRFQGQYDATYKIALGDILIGMDGDFEVHRWSGSDALLNQRVCKITAADSTLDERFLYWYLKPTVAEIHRRTPQTTVRHLSVKDLRAIPAPSVELHEQAVVGQILDTIDTAIRQTEAIIAKLKRVKQGLLHDVLTRGIDANGKLRPPQSQAPHLYKPSPLGWIPKEWEVKCVREVCGLGRGRVISQFDLERNPGPYPVYSSQTKDGGVFGYLGTFDFDGPHVTWTTDGANAGTVFYRDGSFNCTNVCGTLRALDPGTDLKYVALALARTTSKFVSRVGNDKLMNNVVAEIEIAMPSPTEQLAISTQLQPIAARTAGESRKLGKLDELKSGLMDDLLTGRVRVTPLLEAAATS